MTKLEQLEEIYNSSVNGQFRQMVSQMNEYGMYDVLTDLFVELGVDEHEILSISIKYNRITYR